MKFNVTLLKPYNYVHSLALLEAAEYIDIRINQCGYESSLTVNFLDPHKINVIFCGHLMPEELLKINQKLIIFNSEQLCIESAWTSANYKNLLANNYVWDYSRANLGKINHRNTQLIDFYYCNQLNRLKVRKPPKYDLLFYGSINDRRKKILDEITRRGLRLKVIFGIYGDERDILLSESKAILNLHYYDSQIFQQIRAFYPLINQIPIISENYPLETAPGIYSEVVFTNGKELIEDYVLRILSSIDFEAEAKIRTDKFKDTDIENQFGDLIESSLKQMIKG
jgi:hypothetical protein